MTPIEGVTLLLRQCYGICSACARPFKSKPSAVKARCKIWGVLFTEETSRWRTSAKLVAHIGAAPIPFSPNGVRSAIDINYRQSVCHEFSTNISTI